MTIETLIESSKALSIFLQAGFGIFGLTHEFKRDGQLTWAGKIAIAGISLSAVFSFLLYLGQIQLDRKGEQRQLALIAEQQRKQTSMLEQQARTLYTAQRLLLPIRAVRLSYSLGIGAKSPIVTRICNEKPEDPPSLATTYLLMPIPETHRELAEILSDSMLSVGRLAIGTKAAVSEMFSAGDNGAKVKGLDFIARFGFATDKDNGRGNRITSVSCQAGKAYPRARVYVEYNAPEVEVNRGLYSILDLPNKQVGIQVAGFDNDPDVRILFFRVHFYSGATDETMTFLASGTRGESEALSGASISTDGAITRYYHFDPSNRGLATRVGASAEANAHTMSILGSLNVPHALDKEAR